MKETVRPVGHPTEADLILHRYGDADEGAAITRHLESCEECRAEYDQIGLTLDLVAREPVPHRGDSYGTEVWNKLSGRLPELSARAGGGFRMRRGWAMAAAVAMMVISAFLAGRFSRPPGPPQQASGAIPEQVRERILLVALGDHFERSQMMLVELLNTDGGLSADMTNDRQRAEELIAAGRIYGQRAAESGDTAVAVVLEELERVLLDVAHSPDTLSHDELQMIQKRINDRGLLLKVRLIGSKMRDKEKSAAAVGIGKRA